MQVFKVEQWMNKNVITVTRQSPAVEAAGLMRKHNIGCLIVEENQEPIGIVTERDLVRKVLAIRRNPDETRIEEIMSMNMVTVEVNMDIKDVSSTMVRHNIKKVPVVEHGKLKGIVTTTDIVKIMAQFNKLYDAREIIELSGK